MRTNNSVRNGIRYFSLLVLGAMFIHYVTKNDKTQLQKTRTPTYLNRDAVIDTVINERNENGTLTAILSMPNSNYITAQIDSIDGKVVFRIGSGYYDLDMNFHEYNVSKN